jgi:hypothetical protein
MSCIPRIRALEIHITYRCNLRCAHCHNLAGPAPSNEDMPLAFLQKMLDDSAEIKYPWEWLVLHGGEPCLHPEFEKVCAALKLYKDTHNPAVNLKCTTNGYGPHNAEAMKLAVSYGLEICDSKKTGETPNIAYHAAVLSSPTDCGDPFSLGCYQSSECGICFTPRGFYECSPAGAAWRVMGYEPMCKHVSELTEERLAEGFKVHCKHCGYARGSGGRDWTIAPESPISKTWADAIAAYNHRLIEGT